MHLDIYKFLMTHYSVLKNAVRLCLSDDEFEKFIKGKDHES